MRFIKALSDRLVDDWRSTWYQLNSIRLAAVFAVITGVLVANPVIVIGLITLLPNGPALYLVAAGVGLFVFVIPAVTRLWAQASPPCPKEEDDADQSA